MSRRPAQPGRAALAELALEARTRLPPNPIALAGFMGAGKSTVGSLLAELLERPFHDTDTEVERRTGRTVPSFFPEAEPEFRRLEAAVVADLLGRGPVVIALGGGALVDEGTRRRLREESLLVHLHVPWSRLEPLVPGLVASRPLLQSRPLSEVHRLYVARLPFYREAAIEVTVDRSGPAQTAAAVLAALLVR